MSSRYAPSEDGYSGYAPSSPLSYAGDDGHPSDPSVKPMRLKVLYTTDDKTNCMARWPKALHVRTAFLDEKTEVGVVELKTCVNAIVTSSPELVAELGHDYTVYAYDYSEHEVPLVGQGLLSWVLASASAASTGSASQSSTMVTGRVVKNANALFARDHITQTLEVKLRLVPVPKTLQRDYIESLKRYRDISRLMPENFDPQAWTDFLKVNPQIFSAAGVSNPASPRNPEDNSVGLGNVQRLMQQGSMYGPLHPSHSRRGSFAESVMSRDVSPTPSAQSALLEPYRPMSRASDRGLRRSLSTSQVTASEFDQGEETLEEEGQARKRARITQVNRPRKNAGFGGSIESLRVTASTANSVRVLQPTAIRPGLERASTVDEPPRVPTPVPKFSSRAPRRSLQQSRSSLGRVATMASLDRDSAATPVPIGVSPEANLLVDSSPGEDPGSSPPVAPDGMANAAPSSPQLPRLPLHEDSGFMSGALDDESDAAFKGAQSSTLPTAVPSSDIRSHKSAAPRRRKIAAKLGRAETTTSHPTSEGQAADVSRLSALNAIGFRRAQSFSEGHGPSHNSTGSLTKPARAQKRASAAQNGPKPKHPYDKEKQKERLDNRLMNAIAAGEKPPMCENCGSLHSHTWRKAHKKQHSGAPDNVRISKGPGAILTVLVDETNDQDEVTLFTIVKKSLLQSDEGFEDMLLCNPCGLWLVSKGVMRPPKWWDQNKAQQDRTNEASTNSLAGSKRSRQFDNYDRSAAPLPSEITEPPSEAPLAPFESQFDDGPAHYVETRPTLVREDSTGQDPDDEPELPTLPETRRPSSDDHVKSRSDSAMPAAGLAALRRATQSSPGQFRGSKQTPIEVDTTPNPTRRTLFPSPRSRGPLSVTSGNRIGSLQDSPDAPLKYKKLDASVPIIKIRDTLHKENMMPPPPPKQGTVESENRVGTPPLRQDEEHAPFGDYFSDIVAPTTPSRNNAVTLPFPKSPSNTFRTPTKGTPQKTETTVNNYFSSAEKAFLHGHPSTPTRTPSRNAANQTPGSRTTDTPFTRQLKNLFSGEPSTFEMDTSPSKVFADLGTFDTDFPDWPMTTDMPMPSSPPVSRTSTSLLKTPAARVASGNDEDSPEWDELGLGKTPGMPNGHDEVRF